MPAVDANAAQRSWRTSWPVALPCSEFDRLQFLLPRLDQDVVVSWSQGERTSLFALNAKDNLNIRKVHITAERPDALSIRGPSGFAVDTVEVRLFCARPGDESDGNVVAAGAPLVNWLCRNDSCRTRVSYGAPPKPFGGEFIHGWLESQSRMRLLDRMERSQRAARTNRSAAREIVAALLDELVKLLAGSCEGGRCSAVLAHASEAVQTIRRRGWSVRGIHAGRGRWSDSEHGTGGKVFELEIRAGLGSDQLLATCRTETGCAYDETCTLSLLESNREVVTYSPGSVEPSQSISLEGQFTEDSLTAHFGEYELPHLTIGGSALAVTPTTTTPQ
jgi:hypothetical protein